MSKKTAFTPNGFTLIELLIVLAVLATLMSIVAVSFGSARQRLDLEGVAHRVAQDLQSCRTLAVSKSGFCRINFKSRGYDLEFSTDGSSWATRRSYTLPTRVTPGWSAGETIVFDSRGFGSFPASPDPYRITLSNGSNQVDVVPSMTGAARVVKR
ncbi:MAG TPA: prepilin-type N-terminal cleavage/methylation domain-containing protein [Anaerolineae bacterium]|nr:prepilin-type N-terminal cleavage/methylation domain-containing protein [Anaerolineae bacterium]